METLSENRCFGGVHSVYKHASEACGCDMTFGLFLPEEARDGPVPVLWYLSGLTCTHENAMTKAAAEAIAAAMDRLDNDDSLRVGILTGAGGTFCSGMDLKGFLRGESPVVEGRGFGGVVQQPPEKPLIAAVEGYALAGGLELMIACDLVVANAKAKFGIPEVKRGLVAAAGGVMMLPDQIPERIAMELALTGKPDAQARVAGLLHGFAQAASDSPCHPAQHFDLPLSRAECANMLGLTIETVSRKITALEKSGAIRRHGKRGIELVDPARLSLMAES